MFKLICLVILAVGAKDAIAATTLTVTTGTACTHGTATIPSAVDVVMTCDMAATVTEIVGDSTVSVVFKEGTAEAFELPASVAAAGDVATGVAFVASQSAVTEASVTFAAADVNGNLQVTISNFPSDATNAAWTCEVKDSDANTGSVAAEAGQATGVDLATFCTDFTGNGFCGAGAPAITCATGSLQLDAWETDATAVLSFKKNAAEVFKISASNIAAGATSGNLETVTGTWSASAATATTIVTAPTLAGSNLNTNTDWTCDVTGATGSYNGISAAFAYAASSCATFTIAQATCATATSVPSITCTTGTYQLDAWEADGTAVLNVRKDGVVKYSLAASSISSGDTSGTTLTSGTGSWSATSATATAVTIAPTTVATADLGTGWTCDITVATGSFTGGSASMTLSSCSGAEMNKAAGFLLALLVAIKMMLF